MIPVIPHIWFPPFSKVLIHRGEKHPTKIVFVSEAIVLYCFTREHRSLLCWLSTLHHILFFASIRIPSVFCIFICFFFQSYTQNSDVWFNASLWDINLVTNTLRSLSCWVPSSLLKVPVIFLNHLTVLQ